MIVAANWGGKQDMKFDLSTFSKILGDGTVTGRGDSISVRATMG